MQIAKIVSILIISSFILVGCSNDDENTPDITGQSGNKQPLGSSSNDLLSDINFKGFPLLIKLYLP